MQVLEPVLGAATVAHKPQMEAVWEQELQYWKDVRGLHGDSLRKPPTQVRGLIQQVPLTEENSVVNTRTREREHIALDVFNLSEAEWVQLNAQSQDVTLRERASFPGSSMKKQGAIHLPVLSKQRTLW